jgi:RimJ/RimL family protein N-acetyltransferase
MMPNTASPVADLFAGRLVRLTAPRRDDAASFARWSHDADYRRNMDSDIARPETEDAYARQDTGAGANSFFFAVRTLAEDTLIGFTALFSIEWGNGAGIVAIGIGEPAYRDRGYGTDAMRTILRYGFDELNLHRVGLDVHSNNDRAIHVYEKLGFRHEGVRRESIHRDGQWHDRVWMGILRREWEATGKW